VLDGNFAVGCGPGKDYCMLRVERTGAITNEVLEPITFVLAYPYIYIYIYIHRVIQNDCRGFNSFSYTVHLR